MTAADVPRVEPDRCTDEPSMVGVWLDDRRARLTMRRAALSDDLLSEAIDGETGE
jgi:hypothetical protein